MAENSKKHAMEMMEKGDKPHMKAMEEMKNMSPEDQAKWFKEFEESFDSLPEV